MSKPIPYGRSKPPHSRRSRQKETLGLVVIAILILAITIVRYLHNVHWGAR